METAISAWVSYLDPPYDRLLSRKRPLFLLHPSNGQTYSTHMAQTPDPQPDPPLQEISLDELTEAFSQVMGPKAETTPPPDDETVEADEAQPQVDTDEETEARPVDPTAQLEPPPEEDDASEICPRSILEAMLFVGNREGNPLPAGQAAQLMRDVGPEEIARLVDELNRQYAANGCPYRAVREGGGYRLTLCKAYRGLGNGVYGRIREARLSQAAIDVLALVAYHQPVGGEQIGRMRGKPGSHVLSQLVRRGLLRIERRDPKHRTATYYTTDRFLKLFGLETLDDLPQSEDLQRQ